MTPGEATSSGERLLGSDAATQTAIAVMAQVEAQVDAALHGPLVGALAGTLPVPGAHPGAAGQPFPAVPPQGPAATAAAEAALMLGSEVPHRFIAAGAALAAALAGVSDGDDVRAAGGLLCAERILFPDDPAGAAAVAAAVKPAVERAMRDLGEPPAPGAIPPPEAMRRRVVAATDELERAFLASQSHVVRASLSARSWLPVTGGLGDLTTLRGRYGPFLDALIRWAFYVGAALEAVRRDDWTLAGAAVLAAHQQVQQGSSDFEVLPSAGV
jgi:hypothetical protein